MIGMEPRMTKEKNFMQMITIDRIIHWGLTNNFSKFDFGGAGNLKENRGIREYKLKFGGELIEIGRIHYISKPVHYNLGKLGFSILKNLDEKKFLEQDKN